ncbi:molecular chaperone [Pseudomonas abietaniphila]|uniref:fimbrial biogenesis chaperone n=1 Tax=Pseudomonas abietaniphila TaxID=89065 RepID=UPI00321751A3
MPMFQGLCLPVPPWRNLCAALCLLAYLPAGHGALTLSGTRVIFQGDKRSVSLTVANPSKATYAVQTWINTAADDHHTPVPFIASPPLFRLGPGKEQHVQISALPHQLPKDRESLFFFNAQEIPQTDTSDGNKLTIALRSRIKFFYRPAELSENPLDALQRLTWSVVATDNGPHLVVDNPTPFHMSFITLQLQDKGRIHKIDDTTMAAPFSRQSYPLDSFVAAPDASVTFSVITDYGGFSKPLTQSLNANR